MDVINVMMSVTLVMLVRLVTLDFSGQINFRIGTVNCFYFSCSIGVRIVVTLVTSVASGTRVTLVRLVSWR